MISISEIQDKINTNMSSNIKSYHDINHDITYEQGLSFSINSS